MSLYSNAECGPETRAFHARLSMAREGNSDHADFSFALDRTDFFHVWGGLGRWKPPVGFHSVCGNKPRFTGGLESSGTVRYWLDGGPSSDSASGFF